VTLATRHLEFRLLPENGSYELRDRQGGVNWRSNPYVARFGEVALRVAGKSARLPLARCETRKSRDLLEITFRPLAEQPSAWVRVSVRALKDGKTLEFSYTADPGLAVESIRLLDDALWVSDSDRGCLLVPVREGLLLPADSKLAFTHAFDTFAYEGCHMEMLGVVKQGAAALLTWHDPYVLAEARSVLTNAAWAGGQQVLSPSLSLRQSARWFRVQFLGPGDHVSIARAYRQVAQRKGWLVTWREKLKGHPERARLFGAVNYKLWSTLSRGMNEESTKEERVNIHWTFAEAAQVAEHLKRDLQLDKVLFLMGGWIHRGYDNQHPDILPAAPECGGNEAFAECVKRIRKLGYVVGLHDNYQDMYRDSPSWDEKYLMRTRAGELARGGRWAGGRAYLTCSKMAVELAKRPQNLPAVQQLTGADAYFIDTTYAAGLMECFDRAHPLTRWDDMKWKQVISDYARELFGIFGSECGREWAIPHSDFFEGLTGVSGHHYHDTGLLKKVGGIPVPLFELVYRDCIAMFGKYGYDASSAAEYVLHHLVIGRPMHYHSIPDHLYWQTPPRARRELAIRAAPPQLEAVGPRQFRATYQWLVDQPPTEDLRVFVHFVDASGAIKFQDDHDPATPTSQWTAGTHTEGPFAVTVPDGLTGKFDIRVGMFNTNDMSRAQLTGPQDGARRYLAGVLHVAERTVQVEPPAHWAPGPWADPSLFARADNGWADGLHVLDRFVKNTYEVLSPLNELTAQMQMTQHQFLTPDRRAQLSRFGTGEQGVVVTVNAGGQDLPVQSRWGGRVVLPPYGFLVESAAFAAFHARSWGGLDYQAPTLFALRSLDGRPLGRSRRVRVFHAFGDTRVKLGPSIHAVRAEAIVSAAGY
jgi:hypothetical protein